VSLYLSSSPFSLSPLVFFFQQWFFQYFKTSNSVHAPKRIFLLSTVLNEGLVEVLITYPTDVIKTRHQLQSGNVAAGNSNGVFKSFMEILQKEGVHRLYRGIGAPLVAEVPKRAGKFGFNGAYQNFLNSIGLGDYKFKYFIAGGAAGMTEVFYNCKFSVD